MCVWIILKWTLKKRGVGLSVSGPVAGSCKYGTEPSSSLKGGEFRDQLSKYELNKNSALLS